MTLKEERELKKAAKLEAEKQRIEAMREYEEMYDTFSYICGIDEAGRGPLAGPVVVAGVIMPQDSMIEWVNDSKKVTEKRREKGDSSENRCRTGSGTGNIPDNNPSRSKISGPGG